MQVSRSFGDVLNIAAPSIITFTYYGSENYLYPDQFLFDLLRVQNAFPLWKEFTLRGTGPATIYIPPSNDFAPALEYLDVDAAFHLLDGDPNINDGWRLDLLDRHPHLTHLRLSQSVQKDPVNLFLVMTERAPTLKSVHAQMVQFWWQDVLDFEIRSDARDDTERERTRNLLDHHKAERSRLKARFPKLTLSPMIAFGGAWCEAQILKQNWINRMDGRAGQWTVAESVVNVASNAGVMPTKCSAPAFYEMGII